MGDEELAAFAAEVIIFLRLRKVTQVVERPWFSYATIFLLQLKVIWGMWLYRDLTSGDTSYYFLTAYDWFKYRRVLIAWSPLYTSFYGSLLHVAHDAYTVTILHRVLIVLALAILVLALMRRLLPPNVAWLAAVWWVVLPINYDALYEIHLFAVIPMVLSFLVIVWKPGPWGRGICLAILFASTFLMRNELLIATILFAALSISWDLLRVRTGTPQTAGFVRAYGIPLLVASVLILFYVSRATDIGMSKEMSRKHTLNICQTFTFGYQQRHPDWHGSPWTQCQDVMILVFGVPEPSLAQALRRNPRAMLEHFWWNIQLIPSGLQILLFDSMSRTITPDYIPVKQGLRAILYSAITSAIVIAGLYWLIRERQYWWKFWLSDRIWAWIAMGCVGVVVTVVMVTQRPRPSYMFTLGIALRAAIAMCGWIGVRRWLVMQRLGDVMPVGMVALILFIPRHYTQDNRDLLENYRRLTAFEEIVQRPKTGLVVLAWGDELCNYVGKSHWGWAAIKFQPDDCRPLSFAALQQQVTPETPFRKVLQNNRATLLFASDELLANAGALRSMEDAKSHGWKIIGMQHDGKHNWELLSIETPPTSEISVR